jgi:general secretion pathway protein D
VLQYADISDVKEDIASILTKEAGSIHANERLRTIIVTDLPHKMREIEQIVAMFDRRKKQVFIEAKIIEIVLQDDFALGVNWDEIVYNSLNPRSKISAMITPGLLKAEDSSMGIRYKTIAGGADLSLIIQALKKVSDAKVISNPHVAVLDGETAMVSVNVDEPYVETRKDSIGQESVAGTEVKFIPVGVSLEVTPRVLQSMILTKIRPEVSRADFKLFSYGTDDNGGQIQNQVPVVTKSYAETSVMVKSGETIIIAGMIQDTKGKTDSHVPILGRIPLLGVLFRTTKETTQSKELAIFLTPRIITGEKPFLRMRDTKKVPRPLRAVGPGSKKKLKALR